MFAFDSKMKRTHSKPPGLKVRTCGGLWKDSQSNIESFNTKIIKPII